MKEKHLFNKGPILIGGCGRSGTTLLLSVMSAHPHIFAFPHEVAAFFKWQENENGDMYPTRIDRMYRYLVSHHVQKSATRWCEKSPRNVLKINEILNYWDNAHFINIIRDARDVLTSRHPQKPDAYWVPLERWLNDVRIGLKYKDHPRVTTIHYEDLVHEYEKTITKICDEIGEEVVPEIISWYDHATVRSNRAWFGGVERLHQKSVNKWKKEEHAQRLEEIMQNKEIVELQKELGYL
jgi:hypothetical protein